MNSETIIDVLDRLVGNIHAIGSTHVDNERYDNLLSVEKVAYYIIDELLKELPNIKRHEYSMSKSGKKAFTILENIRDDLNDYLDDYEIEQPILDDIEKRYLEGVLRPFKDRVMSIKKSQDVCGQRIFIELKEDYFGLPYFEINKMYKDMELNRRYTLKELGLFEDD